MRKALTTIAKMYDNKDILRLYTLRNKMHKLAEDYCSVPMTEEEYNDRLQALNVKACRLLEVDVLPDCIEISGDPRGWVFKVDGEEIDAAEDALLRNAGLSKDWGGNYMVGYTDKKLVHGKYI